jgi:hypothetical protein
MIGIRCHFDGKVFVPDQPVNLPIGRTLILHVEVAPEQITTATRSLWDTFKELEGTIEAPSDWAEEHDHYLYGTPKRNRTRRE